MFVYIFNDVGLKLLVILTFSDWGPLAGLGLLDLPEFGDQAIGGNNQAVEGAIR